MNNIFNNPTPDEDRIRNNLHDYLDASSEYNHLSWRANQAKAKMVSAIKNLKSLNAIKELEKLGIKVSASESN